ncbi:MAG: Si-specific NAD(P)(+) transhydrogenase [SAR324 cluster bacterium]|nr:Si-specific NAD(P)(+) transhydrogenase [SAR324 cluster bacterium]
MRKYDLVVIGSGPAGEKAAIQAAKLDKDVLMVECMDSPGGSCMHTGTIPSKTLRESVRFISLIKQRAIFGISMIMDEGVTVNRLMHRRHNATMSLVERLENNLKRNNVEYLHGRAQFSDTHRLEIHSTGDTTEKVEAEKIIIATGGRPFRPEWIDFEHPRVMDSDTILELEEIPRTLTIIGAGVVGCEYATIFAPLGVKVNLVNPRQELLDFLDSEISNALAYLMREQGIRIRLGETLNAVECRDDQVFAHTESGKVLKSDCLLYANGRMGNTEGMGLEALGLSFNTRQQLEVNQFFQTSQPHIYGVGDVIGYPSLAATAMDQGRLAALHAFSDMTEGTKYNLLPTGIYTIPEISTVGATEQELTQQKIPYEVGSATYREIARGQIAGNTTGRLKLLFDRNDLRLLGVHIIGDYATDLVHIGQTAMAFGGSIDFFINNVFNYPTYSECYRVAALNGINRL